MVPTYQYETDVCRLTTLSAHMVQRIESVSLWCGQNYGFCLIQKGVGLMSGPIKNRYNIFLT